MNDIYGLLYGAAGGGVVGLIVALIGGFVLHNLKRSWRELDALRERRLAALEDKIDNHLREDNPDVQKTRLDHIEKQLNKISDKIDRQGENIAKMETNFEAKIAKVSANMDDLKDYTRNLHNSMKELREDK